MKSFLGKIKNVVESVINKTREFIILNGLIFLIHKKKGRDMLFKKITKEIRGIFYNRPAEGIAQLPYLKKVKSEYLIALTQQVKKNIDKGIISKNFTEKLMKTMLKGLFYKQDNGSIKDNFEKEHGFYPPSLCTISPTQQCNLKCKGCYASSEHCKVASLPYWVVERLVGEMRDLVGSRFIVISGGEPFLWNDNGKGIIDLAQRYPDMFFQIYTNGLFLDDETIERLLKVGNIVPAISVEGYEKETDERRGKGIYKKILEITERLKKHGLPFGVSVTASKKNVELLIENKFYENWFEEIGASFMWMFQLMPVGRAKDALTLMLSADQRKKLLQKWEELLFDKHYFIADFWNSGAACDGCMAYAKNGGYFYIDWNGNIAPCVFIPYYKDNIVDLYKKDKTIIDAITGDYFARGRKWQREYNSFSPMPNNIFTPCSIKDHHDIFRKRILSDDIKPSDEHAQEALDDPEYYEGLVKAGNEIEKVTDSMWKERIKNFKPETEEEKDPPKKEDTNPRSDIDSEN